MLCKLCNCEGELKKSHIIPEFVYKSLYDDKGRFYIFSTIAYKPRPYEQKGIREKLLCEKCEQKLSIHEKYAREVILGGTEISITREKQLLQLTDLIYHSFKLFLLSIIWRASISNHYMFKEIKLGEHEEKIREMLCLENPGKQLEYPCLIHGLHNKKDLHKSLIDYPRKIKVYGHTAYIFLFAGLRFIFFVTSHKLPDQLRHVILNEKGKMVVKINVFNEENEFTNFSIKLKKMNRLTHP